MIAQLLAFNDLVNSIVWGPPFMVLLLGTGLYLTIRLKCFQFTHLGYAWRHTFGQTIKRMKDTAEGAITPFQAVASAMAGTIGVGNIAGVSTALALGGPGAVFWMWLVALVGMATKFAEATLGLKYRHIDEHGRVSGGVFYYIEKGLGPQWKPLALGYAFLAGIAAFGIGNMVQANTIAHALEIGFSVPPWLTGIIIVVLVGVVTLGGIKRIALTAEKVVPFMAVVYVLAALVVVLLNIGQVPAALGQIFEHAFTPASAFGGFAGATVWQAMRFGIARGIFSNEAGLGSASIVHAQAKNTPVGQGLWGMWEVFIDTVVVCTMTALVVLTTDALDSGATGAELAATAFTRGLPGPGGLVVQVSLALFAYTTMLTWNFYGEKSWEYIAGEKVVMPYRVIFLGFLFLGAIGVLEVIWNIADTLNGLMAVPNLIALIALAGTLAGEKDAQMAARARAADAGED
jgi:AGCS family alanine or glycine:cation symporter